MAEVPEYEQQFSDWIKKEIRRRMLIIDLAAIDMFFGKEEDGGLLVYYDRSGDDPICVRSTDVPFGEIHTKF